MQHVTGDWETAFFTLTCEAQDSDWSDSEAPVNFLEREHLLLQRVRTSGQNIWSEHLLQLDVDIAPRRSAQSHMSN